MTALLLLAPLAAALVWWALESRRRKRSTMAAGLRPDISLPHEREFELYHNALSLCSMKSRVCLAELGVPYASHPIDLIETGSYENIRPAFLAVNPGGTVPVLVHEGHPIYESHEQIRYAAAHAPAGAPALIPEDPDLRKEMERWIDRSSLTDDPINHGEQSAGNTVAALTLPIFAAMIERIATWKILEGLLFHFDRKRPVLFLTLKLLGLERLPSLRPLLEIHGRGRGQMGAHLDALEAQLESTGGPWILGAGFTLADVSWLVIFERLAQVDSLDVFVGGGRRPACAAYWDGLRARPSYADAILGHVHPTIAFGTQRLKDAKRASPRLRRALDGSSA